MRLVLSLLGWGCFLQVPHFQRVIFRRGDQNRLDGVKRETADGIEVVSECELGVPRLPQGVFIISDLRKAVNNTQKSTNTIHFHWDGKASKCFYRLWTHVVGHILGLVGHGEPGQLSQTQFALQRLVRPHDEGLSRGRRERQGFDCRNTQTHMSTRQRLQRDEPDHGECQKYPRRCGPADAR